MNRNPKPAREAKLKKTDKYYELIMLELFDEYPDYEEMSLGKLAEALDLLNVKQPKKYRLDPKSLVFESHQIRQAQQKGWEKAQASRLKNQLNRLLEERHQDSD